MAYFRIDHFSDSVKMSLPLNLILPDEGQLAKKPLSEHKVVFLLHGLSDDASAWQRYTNIEILARDLGMVVVMPTGGRSLYCDMANGQRYFTYITEELPRYLAKLTKINLARENTLIAGLSMGGFGAFKAAFLRPELYYAACSLSGLVSLSIMHTPNDKLENAELMKEFEMIFGSFESIPGSENDSTVWLERAAAKPSAFPKLYAACGLEDDLLLLNRYFVQMARDLKVPIEYVEDEGRHDWYFWQKYIDWFLRTLLKEEHD